MPQITTFILILLSFIPSVSKAQVRHYNVKDGLATEEVRHMVELPNGQIMINSEGAFELFDGKAFKPIPCDRSKLVNLKHSAGYYHLWQGDSLLWLRDYYNLYLFDARINLFRSDAQEVAKVSDVARQMMEGRIRYGDCSPAWRRMADSIGVEAHIECTMQDRQGGKWIGTRNDGVYYLPPARHKATVIDLNDSLNAALFGVKDKRGRTWEATQEGLLCRMPAGERELYNTTNSKGFGHMHMTFVYAMDDGRLLVCNNMRHVGFFDADKRIFTPLFEDDRATEKYRYIVGACNMPDGNLIIYSENGAFVLNTKTDKIEPFSPSEKIMPHSNKYNCIYTDRQGKIWIGTQNGLFVCQDNEITAISANHGLNNNCIRSITEDRKGCIWVGTSAGISRISRDYRIANYAVNEGIPETYMEQKKAVLLDDGRVAFSQARQLVIIDPDSFGVNTASMPVILTGMQCNGIAQVFTEGQEFEHNCNFLSFSFSALNYAAPEHTQYRYMMEGLDQTWRYCCSGDGSGQAVYSAIPPGDYTLRVQASIEGQEWGTEANYHFTILPPWWLTWWAKCILVILCIAAAPLILHAYLAKKKAQMEKANEEKVNKLFSLREEARRQFAKNLKIDPEKVSVFKEEEELVGCMMKSIEENMDNSAYTVDQLAADVAHSRSNLYRHIQSILGITPNDFIRSVRLKHAANLLSETDMPINQIALSTGFSSPRYFSQCFKKAFGVLPSDYRHGAGKTDEEG